METELGVTVTFRMLLPVFLPQEITRDMGPAELFLEVCDLTFKLFETCFLVGRVPGKKLALQDRIIQGQEFIDAVPVVFNLAHIIIYRTLV